MDKTLVVMAAGLSTRYGSVKQIERVGPGGEMLMDYAVFDAIRSGLNRIVFILKPDICDGIRELFDDRLRRYPDVSVEYAIQTNDRFTGLRPDLIARTTPLGTVHAVLCAKEFIQSPFAVINADDYYGFDAFRLISSRLDGLQSAGDALMAAYRLHNTVSSFGAVTRGLCVFADGALKSVTETYRIRLLPDGSIVSEKDGITPTKLDPNSIVSMNMWGLHPEILPRMEEYFESFLASLPEEDANSQCLLPLMMDKFCANGSIRVSSVDIYDRWFGLTYKEDKENVVRHLLKLHEDGVYPPSLWG